MESPTKISASVSAAVSAAVVTAESPVCPAGFSPQAAKADISSAAIKVATENADNLRAKIKFVEGDMFAPHAGKKFDMIVSNPPYIRTAMISILQEEVKTHEPLGALDGGRDGLEFYKIIVDQAADYLKPGGFLMLEIGHDQGEDLRKMLKDDGRYTPAEVIKDLPGKDRVVKCKLRSDR